MIFHLLRLKSDWNKRKTFRTRVYNETLRSQNQLKRFMQKGRILAQLSSGDLLLNEKQKKAFVSLSFITHIITVISYCCFVSASDWGAERGWCKFVLSWHRFETRSFFLSVSLFISKTKTFILRKHAVKAAKSNRLSLHLVEIVLQKIRSYKMPLDAKLSLFAYVISGEQSANRPKQLRNDAFHVKTSQSAKT